MIFVSRRVWRLAQGLTVSALLTATLPVEGALQLAQPAPEPDKVVSCTIDDATSQRAPRDLDGPGLDGPRVAAQPAQSDERMRAPAPDTSRVCPLHPEREPVPPLDRP